MMFKLFFILTILLTTVPVNEVEALTDLSFTESTIVEIESIDNVDFDNPALLAQTTDYLHTYSGISLHYFNPYLVTPYFQNFHSRAPPIFTS